MAPTRPLFAANWKMHKDPVETREFLDAFLTRHGARDGATVVFFPPAISLQAFGESVAGRADVEFGVQDVHEETHGAHTGAISASMAPATGATWGLAGHSERRTEFGDDDATVGAKLSRLFEAGLQPILCVGETLEEREAGRLEEVLRRQVTGALDSIGAARREDLVYAYEPVWAIGTGRTATPADAAEAHAIARRCIADSTNEQDAANAILLYGGSVKPSNIDDLLAAEGVDGVLVGGASLEPASFAAICAGEG
ncbi:MAG: triose-phosphate isomerase [Gemmatimonadota bacterium]|nr:triose-phosphate isomerase [Gemmatimonadota bacterium]